MHAGRKWWSRAADGEAQAPLQEQRGHDRGKRIAHPRDDRLRLTGHLGEDAARVLLHQRKVDQHDLKGATEGHEEDVDVGRVHSELVHQEVCLVDCPARVDPAAEARAQGAADDHEGELAQRVRGRHDVVQRLGATHAVREVLAEYQPGDVVKARHREHGEVESLPADSRHCPLEAAMNGHADSVTNRECARGLLHHVDRMRSVLDRYVVDEE